MLKGKLLTRDVLNRRGIHCEMECAMCHYGNAESHYHLFFRCSYAKRVWIHVQSGSDNRLLATVVPDSTGRSSRTAVQCMWDASAREATRPGGMKLEEWFSKMLCTMWGLWRQRNCRIFREEVVPPQVLGQRVLQEAALWMKYC